MGALLVVAYKVGGDVRGILTWVGINFFLTFVVFPNVSWQGHVGGFVGGLATAAVLVYAPRGPRRTAFQAAGLAGIALVVLAALVAGVAALQ
jgi:hypothetical protein